MNSTEIRDPLIEKEEVIGVADRSPPFVSQVLGPSSWLATRRLRARGFDASTSDVCMGIVVRANTTNAVSGACSILTCRYTKKYMAICVYGQSQRSPQRMKWTGTGSQVVDVQATNPPSPLPPPPGHAPTQLTGQAGVPPAPQSPKPLAGNWWRAYQRGLGGGAKPDACCPLCALSCRCFCPRLHIPAKPAISWIGGSTDTLALHVAMCRRFVEATVA